MLRIEFTNLQAYDENDYITLPDGELPKVGLTLTL